MLYTTEPANGYFSWKTQVVKKLEENNVSIDNFQSNYYFYLLLKNFETVYTEQLSHLKVNEQFINLIKTYSNNLRNAYNLRRGEENHLVINHPVFILDSAVFTADTFQKIRSQLAF